MSDEQDEDFKSTSRLLSTHNLIAALLFVASCTFGMFVWIGQRSLDKLDAVSESTSRTATQVEVLVNQVGSLSVRADQSEVKLDDHEKRITVLETVEGRPLLRRNGR